MIKLHDDIGIIIMTNGILVKMNSEIEKWVFHNIFRPWISHLIIHFYQWNFRGIKGTVSQIFQIGPSFHFIQF